MAERHYVYYRVDQADFASVQAAALNLRLPQNLLDALKVKAKAKGIPYTRYVRLLLESDVSH